MTITRRLDITHERGLEMDGSKSDDCYMEI
jgi:hypothetical protein